MTPPFDESASGIAAGTPPAPPPVPDHELIRRVGRGAYGEVWLARSVTGSWRAVKVVHRHSFDHDRPFEREFEGLLRFEPISRQHDSQLDILHAGRGEGCFYYVMELADDQVTGGQVDPGTYTPRTLKSDLLFRGRLPFEDCVRIGIALATALEHLHANQLVHRDVKPSNIVFANGQPKLADIGLVAAVEATRSYVGTEGFAAPEGPGTPQADLYSLGKVLYEISTGKDRQEFPELPTQLRDFPDRDGLVELNAVIARACRHDPKDRYPSATAMRSELELLQAGKSIARLHRTERRLRYATRAGAALAFLAVLAVGGSIYQARQTDVIRRLSVERAELANRAIRLADENREQLVRLRVANGVRVLNEKDPESALLWFAAALPLVTNSPSEEEIHRIRIQQVLNQIHRPLQVWSEGGSVLAGAFSPDGRWVATGTDSGRVRVREAATGEILWDSPSFSTAIGHLRFTRDGRALWISSSYTQWRVGALRGPGVCALLDVQTWKPRSATGGRIPAMATNLVYSALSPDDRWVAVALASHSIQILDARDGHLMSELHGHTNGIQMLSFSPDGTRLVSASRDFTARLWKVPSGEPDGAPLRHELPVCRGVFSGDGKWVATSTDPSPGAGDHSAHVWEVATGKPVGPPISSPGNPSMLTFAPALPDYLLSASEGRINSPLVWSVATGKERFRLASKGPCYAWDFSPDGTWLAGGDPSVLQMWMVETGELRRSHFKHTAWIQSVQFSPDGTRLLTTSDDGTAKLWSTRALPEPIRHRLEPPAIGLPLNWGRPAGPLPIPLQDASIALVDPATLHEVHRLHLVRPISQTNASNPALAIAPNGRAWATWAGRGEPPKPQGVELWQEKSGALEHQTLAHPSSVDLVCFSQDQTRLVSYGTDRQFRFWRLPDGSLESAHPLPDNFASVMTLLLDHERAVGHTPDNQLELIEIRTQKVLQRLPSHGLPNGVAQISGSDDALMLGGLSGQLGMFMDIVNGRPLTPLIKHGGRMMTIDLSPDHRRVLTAGLSDVAKIWDAATGELLLQPLQHKEAVRMAFWSADGQFIATRCEDNSAQAWSTSTAEPVTPPLQHAGRVLRSAVTRDRHFVTLSGVDLLQSWALEPSPLPPDSIADLAMVLAGQRLNPSGALIPLKPEELDRLQRQLRKRHPELFE